MLCKKGRRDPLETFNQLLHAAADGDGTADVVAEESEGGLGEDLFCAPAQEKGSAVIVLDGAKRVFGNGHPFLLLWDVLLDGEDNARGLFGNTAKGVIVVWLNDARGDLLERAVRDAVHPYGDIDGIRAELD